MTTSYAGIIDGRALPYQTPPDNKSPDIRKPMVYIDKRKRTQNTKRAAFIAEAKLTPGIGQHFQNGESSSGGLHLRPTAYQSFNRKLAANLCVHDDLVIFDCRSVDRIHRRLKQSVPAALRVACHDALNQTTSRGIYNIKC